MLARAAATLLLAASAALPSHAEGVMPITPAIDGHRIDSMGVVPGMTPDQVRAVLAPMGFVETDKREKEFTFKHGGTVMWRSPGFVAGLTFEKPGATPAEQVAVEFTSGISGNQLVAARWSLDWTSGRAPPNWSLKSAAEFIVNTWGDNSGHDFPRDNTRAVFWFRFAGGKLAACPTTPDGMAETCIEGGNFGGPHTLDEYKRFSDVLMGIVVWNHEGRVLRFEHVVDDFQRREAALALEKAEANAAGEHVLAGGDKPAAKPKPTFTGIDVPKAVAAREKAGKPVPVENISTEKAGGR